MRCGTGFDQRLRLVMWSRASTVLLASALFVSGVGLLSAQGSNDIFMCVDAAGNRTFTNVGNTQGCRRLDVAPVVTVPAPTATAGGSSAAGSATTAPRAANNPSPPTFPRVDAQSQRERDETRQQLLQAELDRELARLDTLVAREAELAGLPADSSERTALEADLRRAQASIIELQRELASRR